VAAGKPFYLAEWAASLETGMRNVSIVNTLLAATADGGPMSKLFGWMTWGFNTGFGIGDASDASAYMNHARVLNRGEVSWRDYL
jgi:hypothetical protein